MLLGRRTVICDHDLQLGITRISRTNDRKDGWTWRWKSKEEPAAVEISQKPRGQTGTPVLSNASKLPTSSMGSFCKRNWSPFWGTKHALGPEVREAESEDPPGVGGIEGPAAASCQPRKSAGKRSVCRMSLCLVPCTKFLRNRFAFSFPSSKSCATCSLWSISTMNYAEEGVLINFQLN